MNAIQIAQRIARTQLPPKPAWLLAFEYRHLVEFIACTDYRPGTAYSVWGTGQISEAKAQEIADAHNVSRPRCGETRWLEFKRFTLRADRSGFSVCAFEGDM